MQYLYSALILHKSNQEITEDKITAILEAADIDVDASRVKALVAALGEIDVEEALSSAVMSAPMSAPASTTSSGDAAAPTAAVEEDDDAEEEEEGEILDEDEGLGSLFG